MKRINSYLLNCPYDVLYSAPFAQVGISITGGAIIRISLLSSSKAPISNCPDPLAPEAVRQLHAYFGDPAFLFSLPLCLQGTVFQKRVWRALQDIPVGAVLTYGRLAAQLGSAPQAVGQACRANPIPILIPCHRVVAKSGLGGYMGKTDESLDYKQWLLTHESAGSH